MLPVPNDVISQIQACIREAHVFPAYQPPDRRPVTREHDKRLAIVIRRIKECEPYRFVSIPISADHEIMLNKGTTRCPFMFTELTVQHSMTGICRQVWSRVYKNRQYTHQWKSL